MIVISDILIFDEFWWLFEFVSLVRGASEENNTLAKSMRARNIALVDGPNILATFMLGYFSMVWTTHVFLWQNLSS